MRGGLLFLLCAGLMVWPTTGFCQLSLRQGLLSDAGQDPKGFLQAKKGIGPVAGTPLGCDGKPIQAAKAVSEELRAAQVRAVAARPGPLAYEGTTQEFVKDALLGVAQRAAAERYRLLHPDGSAKKSCSVDIASMFRE